jgi:lipoprotein-anchoring transpeptidase ErfK/SrfK
MRVATALAAVLVSCKSEEPPGASPPASASSPVVVVTVAADPSAEPAAVEPARQGEGGVDDSLPFSPTGDRIASIAWRSWVYTDTGPKRTRYGYLRAGAIVPRRGPEIRNDGCPGGWYRINPRGFVCVGHGATLDVADPVVVEASAQAKRGEGLPYFYALAKNPGPHFYFRLPTRAEMEVVEGPGWASRGAEWTERVKREHLEDLIGEIGDPPEFVPRAAGASLVKPYGTEHGLHRSVQSGQSTPDAGFAISRVFTWEGRTFGLTTELDLIPMDRTTLVKPSAFHGVALSNGEDLPVAIVNKRWAIRYVAAGNGGLKPDGTFDFRQALKLTGKKTQFEGVTFWESTEGSYLPISSALIIDKRDSYPSVAEGSRKWIDVSIRHQYLVAYEGTKAVYATLVSTGIAGLADPEKAPATVRGTYMIHTKHIASTMDDDEDVADSYSLRDVPFVQYFHKGYALHGAYWHDEFGKMRSHGCINLAPIDAAWLFEWTDPPVPEGWHGAINKERGTPIVIHA